MRHLWTAALVLGLLGCGDDDPGGEATLAECSDGVDNDGDGLADCADPACGAYGFCAPGDAGQDAGRDAGSPDAGPPGCPTGQTMCDGACRDTEVDPGHCGACGNGCGPSEECGEGACLTCGLELIHSEMEIRPRHFDWADVDGDGDADLAVAFETAPAVVYENDETALSSVWTETGSDLCGFVAWGDVNGDGRPDLAVGHCDGAAGGYSGFAHVFSNTAGVLGATPVFVTATGLWVTSFAWGDADGDGNQDLFVGTLANLGPASRIYRGDGATFLATPWWTDADRYRVAAADILDVDDDGDGDLLLQSWVPESGTGPEGIYLLRNDSGTYTRPWGHTAGAVPRGWALGSVDADSDVDIVVLDSGTTLSLYTGEGALPATTPAALGSSAGLSVFSLALGDVDGDGDLDLAMAREGAGDEVWTNDGAGTFAPWWVSTEVETHRLAAWIDWDGDGRADELAVGGSEAALRIYGIVCR